MNDSRDDRLRAWKRENRRLRAWSALAIAGYILLYLALYAAFLAGVVWVVTTVVRHVWKGA